MVLESKRYGVRIYNDLWCFLHNFRLEVVEVLQIFLLLVPSAPVMMPTINTKFYIATVTH